MADSPTTRALRMDTHWQAPPMPLACPQTPERPPEAIDTRLRHGEALMAVVRAARDYCDGMLSYGDLREAVSRLDATCAPEW